MSIAVSAVVRPSVRPRLLLAGFAVCALGLGLLQASGRLGPFRLALAGAGASALAGLCALAALAPDRNRHRIDISGVGQIRVTVYHDVRGAGDARVVRLLAGSTLWPGLLLLRLGDAGGVVTTLAVWPGAVAGEAFRPLAVACRAIAARPPGQ